MESKNIIAVMEASSVSFLRTWGETFAKQHSNPNGVGLTISGMHAQLNQVIFGKWQPQFEKDVAKRVQTWLSAQGA